MHNSGYPDDGNWHHIVGTYDRVATKRYVDATLLGSTAYTDPINTSPSTVRIGARDDLLESYNGYLDEVKIYNKALSADEISDLYNNYGYTTTSYPGKVLVRKRITTEPAFSSAGSAESIYFVEKTNWITERGRFGF